MGRTVSYSVVKRNNPLDQDALPKFYAQAQANGHVEIREMADRIQKTCTVTRADVMAVLVALILLGGVKRIGQVTEKLVPFMAYYISFLLSVLS